MHAIRKLPTSLAIVVVAVVLGSVGPGDIRKYNREQLGALVYGAMSELSGPVKQADRAKVTREKK